MSTGREEEKKGSVLEDAKAKLHVTGAVDKKSSGGVEECFCLEIDTGKILC